MSSFGEMVKHNRESRGMKKQRFASELGISTEHLRRIEHDGHVPNAKILARMVAVLHLHPFETEKLLKAIELDVNSHVDSHA